MFRLITFLILGAATLTPLERLRAGTDAAERTVIIEPTGDLTLRQALALALTRSPELTMFAYDIRVAEARLLQASLRPNPELSINSENVGGSGASAAENTLALGQLFELAGKRRKRMTEARLGRELAEFDYEVKKREVFLETHQRFIDVLAGQRLVAVNEEIVGLTESVLPDIQRRIEAGAVSKAEETRSNVAVATARIGLEQARRDLLVARHQLVAQWGSTKPRFGSAVGNLEDAPPIASLDSLTARLTDNPRVARFGTELAHRQATLARERAQAVPDVTINGGVRQFAESDTGAFVLGASVPLPLFNRNQGNIRAAQEQIGKTEAHREAERAKIAAELAEAYHAVQAARTQIDLFRNTVLPQSDEALKTISEGYKAGRFSYLEFLDAQRSVITARQQYAQALVTHQHAVAQVESLTSGPFHRGHAAPNR